MNRVFIDLMVLSREYPYLKKQIGYAGVVCDDKLQPINLQDFEDSIQNSDDWFVNFNEAVQMADYIIINASSHNMLDENWSLMHSFQWRELGICIYKRSGNNV